MSWKAYLKGRKLYSIFQGIWTEDSIGDIPIDQLLLQSMLGRTMRKTLGASYLERASNVFAPGVSRIIRTRPGFTVQHATAINAAGIYTAFIHLGELADEFFASVSIVGTSHSIYRHNANPPGEQTGGTNFTIGADNMATPKIFTDGTTPGAIFVTRLRDLPQHVSAVPNRINFTIAGTGLTSLKPSLMEVFGQRGLYGNVDFDGTVHDDRIYWSAIRDGNLIDDPTTDFLSFETGLKDRLRGLQKISDIMIVGKLNNIFTMLNTSEASVPFQVQEEPAGRSRGIVSQQALIEIDAKAFWMGQTNIHSMNQRFEFRDWADAIQPTIRGLNDARRDFSIAGVDVDRSLILFNVSNSGQTTNDLTIALNYKTGALYLWTLRRNAYGFREVSGQIRLIGGGYVGLSYNEMTGTSGDLDDATAIIDADVITPKYWLAYGAKVKVPYVRLFFDPVGTETVDIAYALDDADILTNGITPTGSPYSISGNRHFIVTVPIAGWAERVQIRVRNNTLDEVYALKAIELPGKDPVPVLA